MDLIVEAFTFEQFQEHYKKGKHKTSLPLFVVFSNQEYEELPMEIQKSLPRHYTLINRKYERNIKSYVLRVVEPNHIAKGDEKLWKRIIFKDGTHKKIKNIVTSSIDYIDENTGEAKKRDEQFFVMEDENKKLTSVNSTHLMDLVSKNRMREIDHLIYQKINKQNKNQR